MKPWLYYNSGNLMTSRYYCTLWARDGVGIIGRGRERGREGWETGGGMGDGFPMAYRATQTHPETPWWKITSNIITFSQQEGCQEQGMRQTSSCPIRVLWSCPTVGELTSKFHTGIPGIPSPKVLVMITMTAVITSMPICITLHVMHTFS